MPWISHCSRVERRRISEENERTSRELDAIRRE